MAEISPNDASTPIVDDNGVMTDVFQRWETQVTRTGLIIGTGSPEGVIEATVGREYMNDTGSAGSTNFMKQLPDIGGDRKKGWIAIGGSGSGETNTASNVGVGGVGLYKQKVGVDLEFKNINAGSSKITITDDTGNNEVDVDLVEAQIAINNLSGTLGIAKGGTGATTAVLARVGLGLEIGVDVQAHDDQLDDIAALAVTDGNFIVGDGVNFVAESGATARTSLGFTSPILDKASPGIIGNTTESAGTFAALTATGAFTSLGIDDNATTTQLTITDTNVSFSGGISVLDNETIKIGTGNDLQLFHNAVSSFIANYVGNAFCYNYSNGSLIQYGTNNSVGVTKTGFSVGGATPNVGLYGDGVLAVSTKASSTYRTINFPAIPTSATGLAAGDVWSNSGVLTVV